ncbi:MAG: YitT family protein [Opitutaceae bacterium]|nr:YitT family protein [Opitutaceae bacterium]
MPSVVLLVVGSAIAALSFNVLLRHAGVPPGGVVGASLVLHEATGLEPGYTQWILNAGILLACGFIMGRRFVLKSLAGALLLPLFVVLSRNLAPLTSNPVLAGLCGGAGVGLGIGLVLRGGSSVGGFSAAAAAINRTTGMNIAHALILLDATVLLAAASIFSAEQALAGLVSTFVVGQTARSVLTGFNQSRVALIVSRHSDEIREAILRKIPLGLTILNGRGGFSDTRYDVLMVVMNPGESVQLKRHVRAIDPQAFVILLDASEVRGQGFLPHV